MCIFFVFCAIVDCIVDLRLLSMVEKESQTAGEQGGDVPPDVDEGLRAGRGSVPQSSLGAGDPATSYSVLFRGDNTPFQVSCWVQPHDRSATDVGGFILRCLFELLAHSGRDGG